MFTGIVRARGTVESIRRHRDGGALTVNLGALDAATVTRGDSLAVNGACLTVAELRGGAAEFAVSPETLEKCLIGEWRAGDSVNLEPALTLQTPLGGHLLTGHIDAAAGLLARAAAGDCARMTFTVTRGVGALIAPKGSVALDGVSLTVNRVADRPAATEFEVMLVPHTLAATTLGALHPGARVHLEADILARYAQRLLARDGGDSTGAAPAQQAAGVAGKTADSTGADNLPGAAA